MVLDDVKDLVAILKFLNLEEPSGFLQPLLHHVCESFPARFPAEGPSWEVGVCLNRPGHAEPYKVSLQGFLLPSYAMIPPGDCDGPTWRLR